jgi:hypothetical protein
VKRKKKKRGTSLFFYRRRVDVYITQIMDALSLSAHILLEQT